METITINTISPAHKAARRTASVWHAGGALLSLSTTGAILDGCEDEVRHCLTFARQNDPDEVVALTNLLVYVIGNGPRPPVQGWSEIYF